MSYEKMEVVNTAEKEASEVLHSLLSVERRSVDSKEAIIVSIPTDQNGGGEYGENAQWHTPVMGQHSVFEIGSQNMQQHNYNGHQEQVQLFNFIIADILLVIRALFIVILLLQVLWQGHTIQVENGGNLQALPGTYSIEFESHVEGETPDMEVDTKPKVEKKAGTKKKKKSDSDSDEEVLDNKLEDNPTQVWYLLRLCIRNILYYSKNLFRFSGLLTL